jgi:hypothetical protein
MAGRPHRILAVLSTADNPMHARNQRPRVMQQVTGNNNAFDRASYAVGPIMLGQYRPLEAATTRPNSPAVSASLKECA